jgi:hypothetical protein
VQHLGGWFVGIPAPIKTDEETEMLKLKKPKMSDMTYRREFSDELTFLSEEDKTWIEIKCRAGGWANPDLVRLRDDIQTYRQAKSIESAKLIKDTAKYAEMSASTDKEVGRKLFEAIFDACVISWDTNIKNDGKAMHCDKDHFLALADIRINEISEYFMEFAKYVDELSNFRAEADGETEKN